MNAFSVVVAEDSNLLVDDRGHRFLDCVLHEDDCWNCLYAAC